MGDPFITEFHHLCLLLHCSLYYNLSKSLAILSKKWKYTKDTSNNYFHINNHNLTHFLLLPIFELRKNKTRPFPKFHSEFFCNIARLNDMKEWKSLVSLCTIFHVPTRLPLEHCRWAYCILFQLNDHQVQILKKEKCKKSPNFRFLRYKVIILRGVCSKENQVALKY